MLVTLLGRVKVPVRPLQPENAYTPIVVTLLGMIMLVTLEGITTLVTGITTSVTVVLREKPKTAA